MHVVDILKYCFKFVLLYAMGAEKRMEIQIDIENIFDKISWSGCTFIPLSTQLHGSSRRIHETGLDGSQRLGMVRNFV